MIPLLDYTQSLKFRTHEGQREVWDKVRKKYLKIQPEELVRQAFVEWLLQTKNVPLGRISVEKSIQINQLTKRYDILVYDASFEPLLLVELKAPQIPLDTQVFKQLGVYNTQFWAPFLAVSNGIDTYFWEYTQATHFSEQETVPTATYTTISAERLIFR